MLFFTRPRRQHKVPMAAAGADGKENGVRYHSVRLTLPQGCLPTGELFKGYQSLFNEWIKSKACHWIYQCEDPTQKGENIHFQGWMHTDPKVRSDQLRVSLWHTCLAGELKAYPLCHVSPASKDGIAALKKYAMKNATRIGGPWQDADGPEAIKVLDEKMFYAWQKEMNEWVAVAPDDRTILWLTDTEGNGGKTQWAKYWFTKGACVLRYAKANDMADIIASNKHKRLYIFDLSRTKPADFKMDDLYSLCEALKDGMITSGKFKSVTWAQNTAHVVVLSNFHPNRGTLSHDRLKEWWLDNGLLLKK